MIAMTNANMKNLPTVAAPAPEKSWDKRDRAVKAAIAELGPQAIPEFDFTIIKCDKRYMWRAIAADKRPPVSDAQVKANGGKRAVNALVSAPDRLAGEAVTSAAVEKIMAAARKPVDTTEDTNGMPAFLKRNGNNSVEAQEALVTKHKKTTGPDRVIKNPPDTGKAKAKSKKEKKTSIAFVAKSAIFAGKDNDKALAEVLAVFPNCGYKPSDVQWYRRKLVKEGKVKDSTVKTGKSK